MSESTPVFPAPPPTGKTEFKVKAAGLASYLAGVALLTFLNTTVTDMVERMPDVAESIVYPALIAAITVVAGRQARTKPEQLSPSTVEAVTTWMRTKMPRRPAGL